MTDAAGPLELQPTRENIARGLSLHSALNDGLLNAYS